MIDLLTIKYMHVSAGRLRIAGNTGVVPRMARGRTRDAECAGFGREVCGDVDPSIHIVVDHAVVVVPEDVDWLLRALHHATLKSKARAGLQIFLRRA